MRWEIDDRVGVILYTVCVLKTNSFLGPSVEVSLCIDGDCPKSGTANWSACFRYEEDGDELGKFGSFNFLIGD